MMKHILPLLLLSILFASFLGCERPEIDNTDKEYPINIALELTDDQVKISWPEVNISTFDSYFILRSTDSISDDINTFTINTTFLSTIQDSDETEFVDDQIPFAEKLYYKVLVQIEDRFLLSPTVAVEFDRTILDFGFDRFYMDQATGTGYFVNNNTSQVFQYNFDDDVVLGSTIVPNAWQLRLSFGMHAGESEIYMIDGSSELKILDASDLSTKETFSVQNDIFSVAYLNSLLFVSTSNFNWPFLVYQRSNNNFVTQHEHENYYDFRTTALLSDTENKMLLCSRNYLDYFHLGASGDLITHTEESHFSSEQVLDVPILSPDKTHIIPYQSGNVYNTETLQVVGRVGLQGFFYQSFAFSSDGTKIFANQNFSTVIEEYSFPEMTLQNTHDIGIFTKYIFTRGDELVILGSIFLNGFEKTVVETISTN